LPPFLLLFFRDDDMVGVVFIRGSVIDEMTREWEKAEGGRRREVAAWKTFRPL
jgi:hypothetical protein